MALAADPAIAILRHRKQQTVWLTLKTDGRIDTDRADRIGRGQAEWTPAERAIVARALDLPEDVLWPVIAQVSPIAQEVGAA